MCQTSPAYRQPSHQQPILGKGSGSYHCNAAKSLEWTPRLQVGKHGEHDREHGPGAKTLTATVPCLHNRITQHGTSADCVRTGRAYL